MRAVAVKEKHVKIAAFQGNARIMDVDHNLRVIDGAARDAAGQGADILLTPELFVSGYAPHTVAAAFTGAHRRRALAQLQDIAQRHHIAVVASLPTQADDGRVHIGAVLVKSDGDIALSYNKTHLFGADERTAFAPATKSPRSVKVNGVRIGVVICYDVEFPETVRAVVAAGAEVVLVPTALSVGFDTVPSVLLPARALENHVTIAYANHTGTEDGLEFSGNSVIVGPEGETIARAGESADMLVVDVDLEAARRADEAVPYLADRRPGLYEKWRQELRASRR